MASPKPVKLQHQRDGTDQEPRIFVVQQGQHVRRDSERQHPFARDWVLLAIDETPEAVICSRRGQDDGGVPTFADEIEEDAENGEHEIPVGQQGLREQEYRKKQK